MIAFAPPVAKANIAGRFFVYENRVAKDIWELQIRRSKVEHKLGDFSSGEISVKAPVAATAPKAQSVSENGLGPGGAIPANGSTRAPGAPAAGAATSNRAAAGVVSAEVPGARAPAAAAPGAARPAAKPGPGAAPAPRVPTLEELQVAEKAGSLVMAARSAQRRGQKEAARAALRQALQMAPADAGALEVLGDLYVEEGEQAKAIAVYEKGLHHHPRHTAFEEKIAVSKLDLAEMEADKVRRQLFLEHGDTEKWQDRNPGLAGSLSLVLPGAGQFYNDEYERGGVMLGVALVSFVGWYWPLTSAMRAVTASLQPGDAPSFGEIASRALQNMGAGSIFVYLMVVLGISTQLYSAYDAAQLSIKAAEARKRNLGIS